MPPVLETERLILRPFTEADIDTAFALFEQDAAVYRFDPGFARTLEQRAAIVKRLAAENEETGEGTLAVTLKADSRIIGQAGLQLYVMPWQPFATPEVELYYKFGAAFWGSGYAYEAARALTGFAFERMRLLRLVTVTHPDNKRSVRLLERLGFCLGPAPAAFKPSIIGILTNPAVGKPIPA
jgi:ribosomal-protein-alanine N-acetyltransferase